jgi:hypothetical protein
MDLGHDAEDPPFLQRDGTIVESAGMAQRRTEDEERPQCPARLCQGSDRPLDAVEERVLEQQVVDRIGGERELGEDRERGALLMRRPGEREDRLGIRGGVGDVRAQRAGGDARETLVIERPERHR